MQCPSRLPLVGHLTALGLLAAVGACDVFETGPDVCAGTGWPLAVLTVVDARSGQGLARQTAVVVTPRTQPMPTFYTFHASSDSTGVVDQGWPGVFDLTVTAPGYASWQQTGLVARNGCPVGESAHVRVPLTRVVGN